MTRLLLAAIAVVIALYLAALYVVLRPVRVTVDELAEPWGDV